MMTSDVFNFIQILIETFHKNGFPCVLKDNPKDLKKEIGPKPILVLLGSNGIFSEKSCLFQSLSFQLLHPVTSTDLESFLSFQEEIEEILQLFLRSNEKASLKCSPGFNVLLEKSIYRAMFILNVDE